MSSMGIFETHSCSLRSWKPVNILSSHALHANARDGCSSPYQMTCTSRSLSSKDASTTQQIWQCIQRACWISTWGSTLWIGWECHSSPVCSSQCAHWNETGCEGTAGQVWGRWPHDICDWTNWLDQQYGHSEKNREAEGLHRPKASEPSAETLPLHHADTRGCPL